MFEDDTKYFSGKELYGDNFTLEEIEKWYKDEEEAYASMYGDEVSPDNFDYTNFDILFGYKNIPAKKYNKVLGFGASWGYEFLPIIKQIENLSIIESSDKTVSEKLGDITPFYIKAIACGKIDIADNTYDLITSFSVLHHIPNVSFVVSELFRILKKDGYLLIREPINSMGDWRRERENLTLHERGIPLKYFNNIIASLDCKEIKISYHYFMYNFLNRKLHSPKFLRSKWYLRLDEILSKLFLWNYHYHPKNMFQRIAPNYVYYIIKK